MWIGVRTKAAVRIALLKRDAHISRNKRIPLVAGGTLFAPASNVASGTIARRLPVRSKMTRASEPIFRDLVYFLLIYLFVIFRELRKRILIEAIIDNVI